MYEELISHLRECAKLDPSENTFGEAADAIEELSKRAFYLTPIDPYNGLKRKYIVVKADTGEDVPDCFVLRPTKDPAAVEALRAYAMATDNKTLADDIYCWVGSLPEPPKEET